MDLNQKIKDFQSIYYHYSKKTWEWGDFIEKYNCKSICEIGVRNGRNFIKMIKHDSTLAVAVDSWIDDGILARNDKRYTQKELDNQYNELKESLKDKPFVKIIRDYSFNAVKQFPDECFDFIYIDADHTFEGCYQDIIDWYPKVKKGGILCGHDYKDVRHISRKKEEILEYGVIEAVDKFTKEKNLEFFILKPIVWGIIRK